MSTPKTSIRWTTIVHASVAWIEGKPLSVGLAKMLVSPTVNELCIAGPRLLTTKPLTFPGANSGRNPPASVGDHVS